MKTTFLKLCLLVGLLLSLTACGFHLRGHEPLPPELHTLYLQSDNPYSAFTKQLQQTLQSIGVVLVTDQQAAPLTLQVINETNGQQLTALGVGGRLATYILRANVTYALLDAHGRVLQPPQTVSTSRNFSTDANQVLGDLTVQSGLQQEMWRDLIYQLMNRLRARGTVQLIKQA